MKCKKKKEYLQETFERETLAKHLEIVYPQSSTSFL